MNDDMSEVLDLSTNKKAVNEINFIEKTVNVQKALTSKNFPLTNNLQTQNESELKKNLVIPDFHPTKKRKNKNIDVPPVAVVGDFLEYYEKKEQAQILKEQQNKQVKQEK